jgi:hypothetical protein
MKQDTIQICQQKTSFKNNVTDYQTKRQRASLHMLLAISISCWLMFVYLLYQQSWQYASMALLVCVSAFTATLMLSRIFNTGIIRRRYPKHYRSWYQWDTGGMEKEWISALDTFFRKRKIKARKTKLLIAQIDERVSGHKKNMAKIHAISGTVVNVLSTLFSAERILILVLLLLIAAFWLLAITVWQAVGTFSGIEDLSDLRRLINEVSFAR